MVASRTAGSKRPDVLRLRLNNGDSPRCPTHKRLRKKLYQTGLLVRAQHQVNTVNTTDGLGVQLGIAARHHHKGPRMLAHHAVDGLTALVVSNISYRTGVDQADVCRLTLLRRCDTHLLKHLRKGRCLREVQLAPQGVICRFFALKG